LLAFALLALACGGSTDSDGENPSPPGTCVHDGTVYQVGESFPEDCNTCYCTVTGVACTLAGCLNGCVYNGTSYGAGESFPAGDGCNTCSCSADGSVACTEEACPEPACMYEGKPYPIGSSFPSIDGCNTCTCETPFVVSCTTLACGGTCTYGGQSYAPGENFPALDGCNTCSCNVDGSISCTEINCPCDPAKEWWREYIGKSPDECKTIKYACPEYTTPFSNACGCGCEQDASCPEWFDCMPPAPCDPDMLKKCPYSGVAY
jgi:hypothetical protein